MASAKALQTKGTGQVTTSMTVAALTRPSPVVGPATPVYEVKRQLEGRSPMSSVVVVENETAVGLVMSYDLDRKLSTPFGRALYLEREVVCVMDKNALIVDSEHNLDHVAQEAMAREEAHLYDDIIVIDSGGALLGTVSVQRLLDTLAKVQGVLATAGAVCHELNQPLQVLLTYSELAMDDPDKDDATRRIMRVVRREVVRMGSLTRRLQQITSYQTRAYTPDCHILDLGRST